jgi:DNA polymerase-3 subunit delta
LSLAQVESALLTLALIDRQAKGLDRTGDAWETLHGMALALAAPANQLSKR